MSTVLHAFDTGLYSAGQPSLAQLEELPAKGIHTVINLRAAGEPGGFDEAPGLQELGVHYIALPITGPDDLNRENVHALNQALSSARPRGGTLIHCATGNRVGAMVALLAAWEQGASTEQALALGRAAGLAALQLVVEQRLR